MMRNLMRNLSNSRGWQVLLSLSLANYWWCPAKPPISEHDMSVALITVWCVTCYNDLRQAASDDLKNEEK